SHNHACVVVFESLCRVNTSNLLETCRIACPERCSWCACMRCRLLVVPWAPPVTDPDVIYQTAALDRVTPMPAVPGRHAGAVATAQEAPQPLLHSAWLLGRD